MKTATPIYIRQHGKGLTLPQLNAVDLLATGKTDTEAAALLNLHRTTLTKWRLYDLEFQAALNTKRAEVWAVGIDRLRALIPKALDVLAKSLEDPDDSNHFKAATLVLKLAPLNPQAFVLGPTDSNSILQDVVNKTHDALPSFGVENLAPMLGKPTIEEGMKVAKAQFLKLANSEDTPPTIHTES